MLDVGCGADGLLRENPGCFIGVGIKEAPLNIGRKLGWKMLKGIARIV